MLLKAAVKQLPQNIRMIHKYHHVTVEGPAKAELSAWSVRVGEWERVYYTLYTLYKVRATREGSYFLSVKVFKV